MSLRAVFHDLALFEMAGDIPAQLAAMRRIAITVMSEGRAAQVMHVCRMALAKADAPHHQAEFWGLAGEALMRRNHSRWAAQAYERAAQCFDEAGVLERSWGARIAAALGTALFDADDARTSLLALSRDVAGRPGRAKARWLRRIKVAIAEIDLQSGRADHALVAIEAAQQWLALEGGEDDGTLTALGGRAAMQRGELAEAQRLLGLALNAFTERGDQDSFVHLNALEAYAVVLAELGHMDHLLETLSKAVRMAERLDDPLRIIRIELLRASAFVDRNPAEATRFILRATDRILTSNVRAAELVGPLLELASMVPGSSLAEQLRDRLRRRR